ncbi:MAG TPA: exosortase system-associated protein, TIGR04073 family [Myxococcota bacterium]|nr:exosortase system-associated protein, TIGR04073 family [Myxococcota bacterium]
MLERQWRLGSRHAAALALAAAITAAPTLGEAAEQSAARKLGRGLAGMTVGFLEIPGNIVDTSRKQGLAAGMTLGFVLGLGKVVVRELIGVYEFVSAPFPLPAGFQPIIEPEFPWDYFENPPGSSTQSP